MRGGKKKMNADTKIIAGVISFAVIIIVIASVLVPVIEQGQSSVSHIEQNTDYNYTMRELQPGETWTYQVSEDGKSATVNGEAIDLTQFTDNNMAFFVLSDVFQFRVVSTSPGGWFMPISSNSFTIPNGASLTISDGIATVSGSNSQTFDIDYCFVYAGNDGDFAYYNWFGVNRYVDDDSVFYGAAMDVSINDGSGQVLRVIFSKTPYGLADVKAYLKDGTTYTDVSENVNIVTSSKSLMEGVSSDIGVYITIQYNGVDLSTTRWVVLPLEYHNADTSDTAVHSIMSVIPIMCIIAVVVGAVQLIRTRE